MMTVLCPSKECTILLVGSEWHATCINSAVMVPLGSKQSYPTMNRDTSETDDNLHFSIQGNSKWIKE